MPIVVLWYGDGAPDAPWNYHEGKVLDHESTERLVGYAWRGTQPELVFNPNGAFELVFPQGSNGAAADIYVITPSLKEIRGAKRMADEDKDMLDPKYEDDIERLMVEEDEAHKKPLRGETRVFATLDDAGFYPSENDGTEKLHLLQSVPVPVAGFVEVTWTPVPGAVGYNVWTAADIKRFEIARKRAHDLRGAFNKRKKQARARTGRRTR